MSTAANILAAAFVALAVNWLCWFAFGRTPFVYLSRACLMAESALSVGFELSMAAAKQWTRLLAAALLLAGMPVLADEPIAFMNQECALKGPGSYFCREIHVRVKLSDKDESSGSISRPPSKLMRDLMAVPGVEAVFIEKYKVTVYRAYLFGEFEVSSGVIEVLGRHGKLGPKRRKAK